MTFHVVTTMNERGWVETGRKMVQSFDFCWPADAQMAFYVEDYRPLLPARVQTCSLPVWLDTFKQQHSIVPGRRGLTPRGYDYRFDAVKFAHKVAAMTDYGLRLTEGVMIWLDADTYTHAPVTTEWLNSLFPEPAYMAWLDRKGSAPETGVVFFRASHPYHRHFMESLRDAYVGGSLFHMREWTDSFAIYQLAMAKFYNGKIPHPVSLSGAAVRTSHPAVNGPLGACLDHLKGERKKVGMSRRRDLVMPRKEPYWHAAR